MLRHDLETHLADPSQRDQLRKSLEGSLRTSRSLMSRWAVVMTGSRRYSGLFDRHVEMIGRVHGLWYFLAHGVRRGNRFRAPGGIHRDDWFVDNLISMTQIAIRLERETWIVALDVVPPAWWDRRTDELAAPAHASEPSDG